MFVQKNSHNTRNETAKTLKARFQHLIIVSDKGEKVLKTIALLIGIVSALAVVFDLYPLTMFLSLPFCLIWIYCGWLRTEPELKWINIMFFALYLYGIGRYLFLS